MKIYIDIQCIVVYTNHIEIKTNKETYNNFHEKYRIENLIIEEDRQNGYEKSLNELNIKVNAISSSIEDIETKEKTQIESELKVQLIYAFNGTGKTRLSREFKELIAPKSDTETDDTGLVSKKIIYYNAFTEDLFYWDNDLENDAELKLKIHPNVFTR